MYTKENNPFADAASKDGKDLAKVLYLYPDDEYIYVKGLQEPDIDPDDQQEKKEVVIRIKDEENNEQDAIDDLDVPGAELDDEEEAVGSEDEENNYYSIGGDEHNNLDEDRLD